MFIPLRSQSDSIIWNANKTRTDEKKFGAVLENWRKLKSQAEKPKGNEVGIAEGLAQWLRSLPPNPEVPGSIPGLVEGWIFGWPSFPLKFTQLSILPGSVKWVPAYMDRFEAAARGANICFRSAGGKLIIVKRLWACYMEKALYKCTALLLLHARRRGVGSWARQFSLSSV